MDRRSFLRCAFAVVAPGGLAGCIQRARNLAEAELDYTGNETERMRRERIERERRRRNTKPMVLQEPETGVGGY